MNLERLPTSHCDSSIHEAIEDFMLHQRACRHSPRTLENYRYSLSRFERWTQDNAIDTLGFLDASALRRFLIELQEEQLPDGQVRKPYTLFTFHKNLKAFFNYLEQDDQITKNPMKRVKPPKLDVEILPAFTLDEIERLEVATAGKDFTSCRNRALIYFLLDSGCRLAEVTSMLIDDIDQQSGVVRVRRGKGGKERITKLGFNALKALRKYLRLRTDSLPNLWIGKKGPMKLDGISITLLKLGRGCGVHCHAHKFRRTTALAMLRNGCDVYSIKALLGHSDLQVLQRYLAQTEQDITRAHEAHGPLDQLRSNGKVK